MKNLVVSLHDVSPLTQNLCEDILAQLRQWGVAQTSLLVIPNHHQRAPISEDIAFRNWLALKVEEGHEPVLHGYFHQRQKQNADSLRTKLTTEIYTAGEGEFFDLSIEEASIRVQRGLADLAFLRRKIVGFIAPAWLLGANAELAIRELGFLYTTRLHGIQTFDPYGDTRAQTLVWSTRARWRAMTSLAWNRCLALCLARAPLIRIGIHPSDFQYPCVWEQIRRLTIAISGGRKSVSYEKFVEIFGRPPHR